MIFPNDTITKTDEYCGETDIIISYSDKNTVLAVAMQQQNISSDTIINCGNSDIVAKNYATNFSNVLMNYQCNDKIRLLKSGNDCATVVVSYVPYLTGDFSTSTILGYNPTSTISSSTDVKIYGSISAGELIISSILLIFVMFYLFELTAKTLKEITTHRKYLQYNGGDVPINKD